MNILIDIRLLGRGGLSGVEEYTRQVVTHLLKIDAQNTYRLFYNGLRKNPLPREWTERKNVSVIDWKIPNRLFDFSSRFLNLPKIETFTKVQVVLSPHMTLLRSDAPRIMTFHDLSFIHHPEFFLGRQRLWHWLQDYHKQAHSASLLIADSQFTKEDIVQSLGVKPEKIKVIYPGIDPGFKPLSLANQALKHWRSRHNLFRPFILYLGTLEPRKNIVAAVKAFTLLKSEKRFKDLQFIIAGRPGWLYNGLRKETLSSPYAGDVIFWGPVENAERIFLYNLAEAFVYPSFFEGFGFPPLEAQACGSPVIVAERTSLTEIIGASGLKIDPWRTGAFAEVLKNVLERPALKSRLQAAGVKNAARFSWIKTAQSIHQCLEELAK